MVLEELLLNRAEKVGLKKGEIKGEKKGEIKGEKRGVIKGELAKAIAIATEFKKMGLPVADIAKGTGLSIDEINKL